MKKSGADEGLPLYLNGQFFKRPPSVEIINPATGEAFPRMASFATEVRETIARAHTAFPSWRKLTAKTRAECLQKIANEVERRTRTFPYPNPRFMLASEGTCGQRFTPGASIRSPMVTST